MASAKYWLLNFVLCIVTARGSTFTTLEINPSQKPPCGNWIPYGEKCLHIVDSAIFQTKEEAEFICQSLENVMDLDDTPRLVTVRSEKEQDILRDYLFDESGLLEPVWLGAEMKDDGFFRWNNGAEMHFHNLVQHNASDTSRSCIQMESGQGNDPKGQWVKVNCKKRNIAVCEKIQVWTVAKLQKSFMELKFETERSRETQKNVPKGNDIIKGTTPGPSTSSLNSRCGDWIPFKNEKCIKLIERVGLQNKEDAERVCNSLQEEISADDMPHLVTVKTEEKQKFLVRYLFNALVMLDNVWLGLRADKDEVFRWNDDTDLFFTNWAEKDLTLATMGDHDQNCVQMNSGGSSITQTGKWAKAACKKRNAVVCERMQPMTMASLQSIVFRLQLEMRRNKEVAQWKLNDAKTDAEKKIREATKQITNLKNNPVPVNFTYVQLPGQDPPTMIWPQVGWSDVSSKYSGLFFRVTGGSAAPFGHVQESDAPRLADVKRWWVEGLGMPAFSLNSSIPTDGSWSTGVITGRDDGNNTFALKFRATNSDIRPRNQAVKVWQRIS